MAPQQSRLCVLLDHWVIELSAIYLPRRMKEQGYAVDILTSTGEPEVTGEFGMTLSPVMEVSGSIADARPDDYDGVICAGGYSADILRSLPEVVAFIQAMHQAQKLVAFMGHGAWIPLSAGILKGRSATSSLRIRSDMENGGVVWSPGPVVVDGHLVSGEGDYGAFCRGIISVLESRSQT